MFESLTTLHSVGSGVLLLFAVFSCLFTTLVVFAFRKQKKLVEKINQLEAEVAATNNSAVGMGQQIIALERTLRAFGANGSEQTVTATGERADGPKAVATNTGVKAQATSPGSVVFDQVNFQSIIEQTLNEQNVAADSVDTSTSAPVAAKPLPRKPQQKSQTPAAAQTGAQPGRTSSKSSASTAQTAVKSTRSRPGDNLSRARRLLQEGATVSEVANKCNLSFAEVTLLQAMGHSVHQNGQVS